MVWRRNALLFMHQSVHLRVCVAVCKICLSQIFFINLILSIVYHYFFNISLSLSYTQRRTSSSDWRAKFIYIGLYIIWCLVCFVYGAFFPIRSANILFQVFYSSPPPPPYFHVYMSILIVCLYTTINSENKIRETASQSLCCHLFYLMYITFE